MLSNLFYRNRRLTLLALGLIMVAGFSAFNALPRQEDPRLTSRFGAINTFYPGASAERVEALVTEKIEVALSEIDEISEAASTSRSGISTIRVELDEAIRDGDIVENLWSQVRDKLSEVRNELPAGVIEPELITQNSPVFTVMVGLTWDMPGNTQLDILTRYAHELDRLLSPVPGTEETDVFGIAEEELIVTIDPDALTSVGLTVEEVSRAIGNADSKNPAGLVRGRQNNLELEIGGDLDSINRIREIPLRRTTDGGFMRISDVATVAKAIKTPQDTMAFINGKPAIVVGAKVADHTRVDHWVSRIEERLGEFQSRLPDGVQAEVIFNQDIYTEERLSSLVVNILLGTTIIILVMIFMMGWRSALLVASALPLTILMVMVAFQIMDVPLHQMSITGLIIALGLLIDNAIVSIDEYRKSRKEGHNIAAAISATVRHLFIPLLASTLTTSLTFMPIYLSPGAAGEFIGTIGLAVILALFSSLALSMTIIPTLAGYFDRKCDLQTEGGGTLASGFSHAGLRQKYRSFLNWTIHNPKKGLLVSVILPIIGFMAASQLVLQFFPPVDRDQFQVQLKLPPQASIEETERQIKAVRTILQKYPEVTDDYWFVGENPPAVYYNTISNSDGVRSFAGGFIKTTSSEATSEILPGLQRELMNALPNATILTVPFEQGPPFEAPIEIELHGHDLDILAAKGEEIRAILARTKNITYTQATITNGKPKLSFVPDEDQAELAGLKLGEIASRLNDSLEGVVSGSVLEGTEELPVRVRVGGEDRGSLSRILDKTFTTSATANSTSGGIAGVPLSSLGTMELIPSVGSISRVDGQRVNKLQAFVVPFTLPAEALNNFRAKLAEANIDLPAGFSIEIGGEDKERQDAQGKLLSTVLPLVVIMIATLVLAFNSFTSALIIGSVAFWSMGLAFLCLYIFGFPMGFTGIMGAMGLIGLAINDSIVILAALRADERARAADREVIVDIVVNGSRHIFSTTLTTVGGFLPLILFGASMWPPLATAIAGGVVAATLLALVYVPILYYLRVNRRARKQQQRIQDGKLPYLTSDKEIPEADNEEKYA